VTDTPPLPPAPATTAEPYASEVGASSWRSTVLRQAQRLSDELEAMPEETRSEASSTLIEQARQHIVAARAIAKDTSCGWERVRNWWTGSSVETAWNHLQTAREDLMLVAPTASVRASLPSLQRRLAAAARDPAHDPMLNSVKDIAAAPGDLTADQRGAIRAAHEHVRFTEDDHSEARLFRNNLLLWTGGLTIVAFVLAFIPSSGFAYLAVGAGAGMLTTALAWRNLTQLSGPFSINTAQALLKVPAGATAALLGVILVRSGVVSGLTVTGSTAYGYAVIFGLSKQALTQVVDSAAKKLAS
jgi:hypothetical protein